MTSETNSLDIFAPVDCTTFDFWQTSKAIPALEGDHTAHVTAHIQYLMRQSVRTPREELYV